MDLGTPARGLAFIRHVTTEDRYAGGSIIIPDHVRDKVSRQQFNVVAVGLGDICEEPDDCGREHDVLCTSVEQRLPHGVIGSVTAEHLHTYQVRPGDWVLCRNRSWAATPDPDIYVIRQSDILGKWVEG